jgi:SsrA-binding protein
MGDQGPREEEKTVAQNRKARHEYFILETYEAGIVLTGTEIKSVRESRVNLKDGYARIENGELWLYKVHISPYEKGSYYNPDPDRNRKLLMKRHEIIRLGSKLHERGLTLVPLRIYIKNRRWAKGELALVKHKTKGDQRDSIAERDAEREMARAVRRRREESD